MSQSRRQFKASINNYECTALRRHVSRLTAHTIRRNNLHCRYHAGFFGKWDLGTYTHHQTPSGRGFDESLLYFAGSEDHWSQRSCHSAECLVPVTAETPFDLWQNNGPAVGLQGTRHNDFLFNDAAVAFVRDHNPSVPMLLYVATSSSHSPLQTPAVFMARYPQDWNLDRLQYAGLCSMWDSVLGNVTAAVKAKGMWNNTLLVFSSDNGGPTCTYSSWICAVNL